MNYQLAVRMRDGRNCIDEQPHARFDAERFRSAVVIDAHAGETCLALLALLRVGIRLRIAIGGRLGRHSPHGWRKRPAECD